MKAAVMIFVALMIFASIMIAKADKTNDLRKEICYEIVGGGLVFAGAVVAIGSFMLLAGC